MSKLYREILDSEREKVFQELAAFKDYGVLAGGTALALQLGHRRSFDFDIFLPKPISAHFIKKVISVFGQGITIRERTGDVLLIKLPQGLEVHFVYFWYKSLFKTVQTDSINLAAMGDIAADKAHTIGRRGQWRDYVDIFFLLKKGVFTLEKIINLANEKYRPEFNPRLFLEQLTYFGDVYDYTISFLEEIYEVEGIQQFLIDESRRISQLDNVRKF